MAITLTSQTLGDSWIANGNSADWSGGETLMAAATGKTHVLERVIIQTSAAEAWTIRDGTTAILGPFTTTADNAVIDIDLKAANGQGYRLTQATALTALAGGAAEGTIVAFGHTDQG